MTDELKQAIEAIRGHKMTVAELDAQRISFAYGNAPEEDNGTRESVARSLKEAELA